jgi:hypothetical protein
MIRNYGKHIKVAWSASELLWLRAAISLGCKRKDLQDIADMKGRTLGATRTMAYTIRRQDILAARAAASVRAPQATVIVLVDESTIPWPTPAQLAGSTRVRTYNGRTT